MLASGTLVAGRAARAKWAISRGSAAADDRRQAMKELPFLPVFVYVRPLKLELISDGGSGRIQFARSLSAGRAS